MPISKRPRMTDKEEYLLDALCHVEAVAHAVIDAVEQRPWGPPPFGSPKERCGVQPALLPPPYGRWCFAPPGIGPRPFAKGCGGIAGMGHEAEGGVPAARPRRKARRTRSQVKS